ncbi:MAG: hypothetical protein AAF745_07110, partial [Planctomycetota bacterium]
LPSDEDALTLPEMLKTLTDAVWSELDQPCPDDRNDRKPMISSLRRNLQREHLQRLIDLILEETQATAAYYPISTLARMELRKLGHAMTACLNKCRDKMDAYSRAHVIESNERIERALQASYTYGSGNGGGGMMMMIMFGKDGQPIAVPATK